MQHHGPAEMRHYVEWLRESLGLDRPPAAAPAGSRPLFVGMDPDPPAKRARRPPPSSLAQLPLEIIRMIYVETLFPHGMLHLNQIRALGGRETRTRAEFEGDLVQQFKVHRTAYSNLRFMLPEYAVMLAEPGFRRLLYRKWLAIAPEGLYQKPEPSLAIPPDELRTLQIPAYPYTDTETGLLSEWWYTDFLVTVMYNEWRRTVSVTIARGLQFFFVWKHVRENPTAAWSRAFDDYWRPKLTMDLGAADLNAIYDMLQETREFTLGADEIAFYAVNAMPSYMRHISQNWLGFQSFNQKMPTLFIPEETRGWYNDREHAPQDINASIPFSVKAMWHLMRDRRVEIVRMLRFANTLRAEKVGLSMSRRSSELYIAVRRVVVGDDTSDLSVRSLLVVDRPYDMKCLPDRPDLFHAPGGFVPWARDGSYRWPSDGRHHLKGFNWATMHGMREALEQLTEPDPITKNSEFRFINLEGTLVLGTIEQTLSLETVEDLDALMERLQTMSVEKALSYRPWNMN